MLTVWVSSSSIMPVRKLLTSKYMKNVLFLFITFSSLLTLTSSINAQTTAPSYPVSTSWEFSFKTKNKEWFQSPVDIVEKSNNQVVAAVLRRIWFNFTDGKLLNNKLILSGNSDYGDVKIKAKITDNSLTGSWKIGKQNGTLTGKRIEPTSSTVSFLEIFDFVQATLDKQFYDPQFNGANWKNLSKRYREQAANVHTNAELVIIIRNMLAELGTSHIGFYRRKPAASVQSDTKSADAQSNSNYPVVWKKLSPQIGYIQIKRFDEGKDFVELVDKAFADIGATESLIIDLRDNQGGTLSIGMRLCDYLLSEMRPMGVLATRRGFDNLKIKSLNEVKLDKLPAYTGYNVEDFQKILEDSGIVLLKSGGRVANPYRGRITVLINEESASAAEGFAAIIKETTSAKFFGQKTAGALLSSDSVEVPGGWTLLFPEADFITAGGARIEGKGVAPDIIVPTVKSKDAPLERAIKFLKGN